MPRPIDDDDTEATGTVHEDQAKPRSNGYDGDKIKNYMAQIEAEQAEIDDIMQRAKEACEPHRQEIAAIKKRAAEDGLPKKELSAVIRRDRLLKAAGVVGEMLTEDQRDNYQQMLSAIGAWEETPLGQTAGSA